MTPLEEILARFIFLFLKHLSIELSNLIIMKNNDRQPKKSILRKSSNKNLSLNQNNSVVLTQKLKSLTRRKVLFTHIDSYEFDPQIPCRFINSPQREQFYLSPNDKQMQCLCHRHLKASFQNKSKTKRKRE
ncbi:unnamed protein product [Rotaria magnacalcarata]|uniref:Uncharacterized protein n=1 Tax=Rotaria magnacalcarata TaxID=392030 RepID=A0A816TM73_9BILA|nr:unnamed protein product [Rotaria magnacalcarata]CAF2093455.1 unnamed protein product [Rotaria magnacalcarata]CAF3924445.1 unnamed protein product [Rotaria magnacalcarata]CAF5146976.1 unnamed protein product [Rotaria magnacalcarata]